METLCTAALQHCSSVQADSAVLSSAAADVLERMKSANFVPFLLFDDGSTLTCFFMYLNFISD